MVHPIAGLDLSRDSGAPVPQMGASELHGLA